MKIRKNETGRKKELIQKRKRKQEECRGKGCEKIKKDKESIKKCERKERSKEGITCNGFALWLK